MEIKNLLNFNKRRNFNRNFSPKCSSLAFCKRIWYWSEIYFGADWVTFSGVNFRTFFDVKWCEIFSKLSGKLCLKFFLVLFVEGKLFLDLRKMNTSEWILWNSSFRCGESNSDGKYSCFVSVKSDEKFNFFNLFLNGRLLSEGVASTFFCEQWSNIQGRSDDL